jgi:flagellar motility protein MotE (MotC chaperone)
MKLRASQAIFHALLGAWLIGFPAVHAAESSGPKEGLQVKEDYCSSFAETAAETRFALQQERLAHLKKDVEARLSELQSESKRLQDFLSAKQKVREQIGDGLTKIYANMEPEAAVKVIKRLHPAVAAEILVSLNAKQAGNILALMDAKESSRIVAFMASIAYSRSGNKS